MQLLSEGGQVAPPVSVKRRRVDRVLTIAHPAVADRVARIRAADTPTPVFRKLVEEIGTFLAYEATRTLPLRSITVTTLLGSASGERFSQRPVVAPILRAGLGLLPGFLGVVDDAIVAHLGFFREPSTLEAIPYYANLPSNLHATPVFVLDPMLATGHSAAAAVDILAARGATDLTYLCVLAATQGLAHVASRHPGIRVVTCAIDERLDDHGYIVPGLGDAGDRMFGSASSVPDAYAAKFG